MKRLLAFFLLFTGTFLHAQFLEGDALLAVVEKPITDPLVQQLKQQEHFVTNAWNSDFTIYLNVRNDMVEEMEFQNGKKRYSSDERYGVYKNLLPLKLQWSMTPADFATRFGSPVFSSTNLNFSDYRSGDFNVRVFFESSTPVSISFRKTTQATASAGITPAKPITAPKFETSPVILRTPLMTVDTLRGTAGLDWNVLQQLLLSNAEFQSFAGTDSVDYIGEVFYNTPNKVAGFTRSAFKRKKKNNDWYFEAFTKIVGDSNRAREVFFGLYDELKKQISAHTGNDFILASSASKSLSETPMNWMAQWSLYSNYKTLPPGLGQLKIGLLISGLSDIFNDNVNVYTFKIYIFKGDLNWDFFTWDTPK